MRVTTGRVVDGRIEVAGESFPEGVTVTLIAPDDEETFELGPEDEAALLATMAEGDRDDFISADEFSVISDEQIEPPALRAVSPPGSSRGP
jgi:hypothetical protein